MWTRQRRLEPLLPPPWRRSRRRRSRWQCLRLAQRTPNPSSSLMAFSAAACHHHRHEPAAWNATRRLKEAHLTRPREVAAASWSPAPIAASAPARRCAATPKPPPAPTPKPPTAQPHLAAPSRVPQPEQPYPLAWLLVRQNQQVHISVPRVAPVATAHKPGRFLPVPVHVEGQPLLAF